MALKQVQVLLTANASSLRSQLALASREVDQFGRKVKGASQGTLASSKLLAAGALAVGAAVAAGLAYSVNAAVQFETRMRNVNSISGESEARLSSLGNSVLQLSRQLPQSANTLAEGLYDIASSGFQGADGLTVLRASAEAASAGLSDTATSAKAITSVLNAYGLGAKDAEYVSDVLFQTVNYGVVSFGELAGVIGDVVGTAAAAGVTIDQVGAAIATMTLSGISAAEAGTSLNRLMQSLLQPGDELAVAFNALGYESGAAALKTKGLNGVMQDLQKLTGGNIETMLALFPEIRAARGALALLSAEGSNYARVSKEIENRDRVAGATRAALAEQMKSLSAQFRLFVNNINVLAITVGTKLLPILKQILSGAQRLGREGLEHLKRAMQALQPFFRNMKEVGGNVVQFFRAWYSVILPVNKALIGLAAIGVIQALNAISEALSTLTGFMSHNEALIRLAAAALVVSFIPATLGAAKALATLALDKVAFGMFNVAGAVDSAALSMTGLRVGAIAAGAVLLDAFISIQRNSQQAKQIAQAYVEQAGSVNKLSDAEENYQDLQDRIGSTQKKLAEARHNVQKTLNPLNYYSNAKAVNKYQKELSELHKTEDKLAGVERIRQQHIAEITKQTGLGTAEVTKLADELNVHLGEKGDKAVRLITARFQDLAAEAGLSQGALGKAADFNVERAQAIVAAISDMQGKVGEAFGKTFDVIGALGQKVGATGSDLKAFYTKAASDAKGFLDNIRDLTARGLDPATMARLLQAGPEAAGPLVQAMVKDNSGNLIKMVNDGEKALREINSRALQFARLTAIAVNATTSDITAQVGTAMQIMDQILQRGTEASWDSIATAIGVPKEHVLAVARNYGLKLVDETQEAIDSKNLQPPDVDWSSWTRVQIDAVVRAASGIAAAAAAAFGGNRIVVPPPKTPSKPGNPYAPPTLPPKPVPTIGRATGGIDAHIARSAAIMYGERGTGGEAFIPLGRQHWSRSRALWEETGAHLGIPGMAGGGLRYARSARANTWDARAMERVFARLLERNRPINMPVTIREKTSPTHIAAELSWRLSR